MKPYVSIICPTNRVGGLDVLFTTLQNQSFKDFELLLVDSLYYHRKNFVSEQSKKCFFPVKHLTQLETATDLGKCLNNALIHANGNIIYFLPDYTWIEKDCLQKHTEFHLKFNEKENYALIGHFWDCKLPILNKSFDKIYATKEIFYREDLEHKFEIDERLKFNEYLEDVNSGKLNNLMWSIFENPITNNNMPQSFEVSVHKIKLSLGVIEDPIGKVVLKNESFLLNTLLDINGFNEALDGSHGWEDMNLVSELTYKKNIKFYYDPEIISYTFNPRNIIYARYRRRDVFSNEKIWQDGISAQFKNKVNNYSLREAREYINSK